MASVSVTDCPLRKHSCRLNHFIADHHAINTNASGSKPTGTVGLYLPLCCSHRQIAPKMKISASGVSDWRYELVEQKVFT